MSIRYFIATERICLCVGLLSLAMSAAKAPAQTVGAEIAPPYELWKINVDGSGLAPFAKMPGYTCGSPEWSPDGELVAFDTWRVEETYSDSQIAVIRADGSGVRLLGPGAMPSWSPDGAQLVFHTYDSPQSICVINADGTGREKILDHWGSPRWMPRGNRIASIGRDRGIALLDLATGREYDILAGPHSLRHGFSVAPDGQRFCFGDYDGGVAIATLDERTMRASVRWVVMTGASFHSSWSPDGRRLVLNWRPADQELEQLYVLNVDSNDPPTRLPGQDANRKNACPAWSPDGKTIVFASQSGPESSEVR